MKALKPNTRKAVTVILSASVLIFWAGYLILVVMDAA